MAALVQDGVPPEAQAQLNGFIAEEASKTAVPVHTFNPDATPQEKAAVAEKGKDKLDSVKENDDAGAGGKGALNISLSCLLCLTKCIQPCQSTQGMAELFLPLL